MKKRLFSAVIAAVSAISAIPCTACAEEKQAGYTYTIIDNEVTVTGFEGEPTYIEIPEIVEGCRVTEIRDNAFYECGSLRHIALPDSIEKIGHHAFYACYSLESITIPDSVTEIGMGCFCGCETLSSVTLPDNIQRLPDSCFRSCTALTAFDIPVNVTDIGDFCFSGCTSLSRVTISDSVESIGDCAFYMCGLDSLYIPESVDKLGTCSVGFTPTDSGASQVEDFTIMGIKKSPAARYAEENSLSFCNAEDSVHAFAIQSISGRRINIPSIFVISGIILIIASLTLIILKNKKNSKK